MTIINVLLPYLAILASMAGLWINTYCLDNLPKHALAEKRHHIRWATIFLVFVLIQVMGACVMNVSMIQTQYQQSMEVGK